MKKSIFALLVLMLAGTVTAANVAITVTPLADNNGWASISYTADANVRAFALDVQVTGANIVDVNHYHKGESKASSKGFGIFLGDNGVDINDAGGVDGWGSPVAASSEPGAAGTGIGTNKVIIGMGALYEDGNQPPLSGKLCDIKISSTYHTPCAKVSVTAEDTYRVGVVLEDTNSVTPDVNGATNVCLFNCSDGTYGFFDLRSRCDNTNPSFGDRDGKTDGSDLTALLYFWDCNMTDCNGKGGFKDLCWRCDNTNPSFGGPDGKIDGSDLTALLYFWAQYSCN
jgi:hypothetical protein